MGCTEAPVKGSGLWGLMSPDWLQHRKFSIQEQKITFSMFPRAFLDLFSFNVFVVFPISSEESTEQQNLKFCLVKLKVTYLLFSILYV